MKREEAVSLLGWLKSKTNREDDLEAIDIAIKALKGGDGDLVSRADAIESVAEDLAIVLNVSKDEARELAEHALSALPSAEPSIKAIKRQIDEHWYLDAPSAEAVQGEWIDIDNYYRMATCSHCHKVTMFEKWGEYTKPYDFCPNCGSRMTKGGDDE